MAAASLRVRALAARGPASWRAQPPIHPHTRPQPLPEWPRRAPGAAAAAAAAARARVLGHAEVWPAQGAWPVGARGGNSERLRFMQQAARVRATLPQLLNNQVQQR